MVNGPSRLSSQPGTCFIKPGTAIGTHELHDNDPALPKDEAPSSPGGNLSMSSTWRPSFCKKIAQQTPTIPAPITTTGDSSVLGMTGLLTACRDICCVHRVEDIEAMPCT